jgi:hypothetical protein
MTGILRLSFPHHVNHLDPTQDHTSAVHRLETKDQANAPLDGPMDYGLQPGNTGASTGKARMVFSLIASCSQCVWSRGRTMWKLTAEAKDWRRKKNRAERMLLQTSRAFGALTLGALPLIS